MKEKIRIGQIGICHEHASGKILSLRGLPEVFEIVGVVDDRETSKGARFLPPDLLKPYEGLRFMTEEELLAVPGLRAVTVETPNADLVKTALRCMERGLSMHMDKPGGEDLALFGTLRRGCEARGLPFQMGYMFRHNPAIHMALRAVREKWLGEVFEIQASMSHDYGGEAYRDYLGKMEGGILYNLGGHLIDLVVSMLGRPLRVTPFLQSGPGTPGTVKNLCLAILEYPHANATLRASSLEVDGLPNRRLKICGTQGTIDLCPMERFDGAPLTMRLTLREGNAEFAAGTHTVDAGVRSDRYQDQLLDLAAMIRGERGNPYGFEHDYMVQEILLAASGRLAWRG
ncbi:MAG: Gfo/Idh/MocA family oxidoreductase [Spirochaetes bacterium]|nr:Gfo/Idh/MocA family oxidoreductase [Spirochaetota bacterium]